MDGVLYVGVREMPEHRQQPLATRRRKKTCLQFTFHVVPIRFVWSMNNAPEMCSAESERSRGLSGSTREAFAAERFTQDVPSSGEIYSDPSV